MPHYTVQKVAEMSGITVRTLHYYDKIGLLKPSVRTRSRYRKYGELELLRLQQILFYKELDFSLKEISAILDDPGFDVVRALKSHKEALKKRKQRLDRLLDTIDKTIEKLNKGTMLKHEKLYEGLPKEKAEAWRNEAIEKWGRERIEASETSLRKMSEEELNTLKNDFSATWEELAKLAESGKDPMGKSVQAVVACHYECIRAFWGREPEAEAYKGLGELYVHDERYTATDGKPNPRFAEFLKRAMTHFADTQLK